MSFHSRTYPVHSRRRRISYGRVGELTTWAFCGAFLAVAVRQALAAPIRFFAPQLWYLPDALMMGALLLGLIYALLRGRSSIIVVCLLFASWVTGSLVLLEAQSVLFGLRMIMAVTLAFIVGYKGERCDELLRKFFLAIAIVSIAGVLFESLVDVPWKGAEFAGALGTKQISRQWWSTDETVRVAGFGISSTDTALFVACAMLMLGHGASRPRGWKALALMLPAVYAISLTQQKATMVWFAVLFTITALAPAVVGPRIIPLVTKGLKTLCIAALVGGALAPFVFYKVDIAGIFGYSAPSLLDRTSNVWPGAIDRIGSVPQFLLGNGIGSVGEAASFTDVMLSVPPDNLFLYVYIMGGIAIFLLMLKVSKGILAISPAHYAKVPALAVLSLLLLNGVTANILEGLVGTLFMGLTLGVTLRRETTYTRSLHASVHR